MVHITSNVHTMMLTIISIHRSEFDCSRYSVAGNYYKIMFLSLYIKYKLFYKYNIIYFDIKNCY